VLPNGNLQGGADSRGDDTVSAYWNKVATK
jgi:hypothetical protein